MALGFSMAFGAMFSKTWRVHKIFTNKKIQRMVKDLIQFCNTERSLRGKGKGTVERSLRGKGKGTV